MPAGALKVLLVAHALAPWQMQLWAELSKHVDLHVVGAANAPNVDSFPRSTELPTFGEVRQLTARGRLNRGHTWWVYQGLGKLVDELSPDVVHVSSEPWGLLSQQALATSRPVVLHGVENIWQQGGRVESTLRSLLARRALRRVSGFVSWNSEAVGLARSHGLPAGRPTLVCPFAVSPAEPYRAERERVWTAEPGKPLTVGFAGRIMDFKGLDWLVEAAARARAEGTDVCLQIAGSGPMSDDLVAHAHARGVPLSMLGAIATEALPGVMGGWDVAVVPSLTRPTWKEQFGRSAVEAMMCGLPVIVSDTGALPEVVGGAGRVVAEGDVAGLADAIAALADPVTRAAVGRACAQHVDDAYAADVLAVKMLDFWHRALNLPSRPAVESPLPG